MPPPNDTSGIAATPSPGDSLLTETEPAPGIFGLIREDIRSILKNDPAAHSRIEVILCYSGQHAIWAYRFIHRLWLSDFRLAARWLSQLARAVTGIEIHPGARLGRRVFIDHGMGVVIGETAEVGSDVTLYHGVTLGGTSLSPGKRHPTVGDRVVVGAGAKLLGDITIGNDCRIGANSVVVKPVPSHSVVVGIPGQIIVRSTAPSPKDADTLTEASLPDAVGTTLRSLLARVDQLERTSGQSGIRSPVQEADGTWHSEDFVI